MQQNLETLIVSEGEGERIDCRTSAEEALWALVGSYYSESNHPN
jgi:hypothetical protein